MTLALCNVDLSKVTYPRVALILMVMGKVNYIIIESFASDRYMGYDVDADPIIVLLKKWYRLLNFQYLYN